MAASSLLQPQLDEGIGLWEACNSTGLCRPQGGMCLDFGFSRSKVASRTPSCLQAGKSTYLKQVGSTGTQVQGLTIDHLLVALQRYQHSMELFARCSPPFGTVHQRWSKWPPSGPVSPTQAGGAAGGESTDVGSSRGPCILRDVQHTCPHQQPCGLARSCRPPLPVRASGGGSPGQGPARSVEFRSAPI